MTGFQGGNWKVSQPECIIVFAALTFVAVGSSTEGYALGWPLRAPLLVLFTAVLLVIGGPVAGPTDAQEILFTLPSPVSPIFIRGTSAQSWQAGEYEVVVLEQGCRIAQGNQVVTAERAVLWIEQAVEFSLHPHKVLAYLENARFVSPATNSAQVVGGSEETANGDRLPPNVMQVGTWYGSFYSQASVDWRSDVRTENRGEQPQIFARATAARAAKAQVQLAQFVEPAPATIQVPPVDPSSIPYGPATSNTFNRIAPPTAPPTLSPFAAPSAAPPFPPSSSVATTSRHVRVFPRTSANINAETFTSPDGRERIVVVSSGVNILIESSDGPLGKVDIATDRVVIWRPSQAGSTGGGGGDLVGGESTGNEPIEFYLEGNIVFRQGDRVFYANSMYYSVQTETGVLLGAEMLTPAPQYQGLVRLKADVLRQLNRSQFSASGAAFTSSRLGIPRYWFQTDEATLEDRQQPQFDPISGQPLVVPNTGEPFLGHDMQATSRNNFVYAGGIPVFYWPFISTDLTKPTFFIDRITFRNDRIFGTQVRAGVDLFHLFGIENPPDGTTWRGSVDYLSERGFGGGTELEYARDSFLGFQGPARGFADAWFINDTGVDVLGRDRLSLTPEEEFRGRVLWQHRQRLVSGWQFTGELGWVSDRNFLEQYYEPEWDLWKDQDTGFELKRLLGSNSFNITTNFQLNDFFTQTEWLPKLDHFLLGQSLIGDTATVFSHNQAGYAKLRPATAPTNAIDDAKFNPLAWEVEREGLRAGSRTEVDFPVQAGAVKVVPYLLGEAMHWGENIVGDDVTRLFGQAGIRASLPMHRTDPNIHSQLLNLNGLSHKVNFDADFFWADAEENMDTLPLYDRLDDNSVEHFRRRFVDDVFGGLPNVDDTLTGLGKLRFDERFFALRSGMQRWVTAPSTEIADDLMLLQLSANQRWQTKRGLPGNERIVDWITLDTGFTLFPKASRDNFGESLGLLNYDFRWHLGDRFTLMSDGLFDTFEDGLRMITVGGNISRPERGNVYLGFRNIEGPISSNVLASALSYRMSQKWIGSVGAAVDFGSTGNIGQHVELTRIGESFLTSIRFNVDSGRDNVGIAFAIEPRFLPLSQRSVVGGVRLPPAGAYGLE